jgi:hypothetical protein
MVAQTIVVTVDETKFTSEFMREFRLHFYPFDTLDKHIEHLAQLHARGLAADHSFIEGYGPAKDMGIRFRTEGGTETDILGSQS